MSITFNTNISALGTQRYLGIASDNTSSSLAKLSSGSRVPTAKDDAAALAVGTQLKAQVAGLQQASLNASQASSVLQIADGALSTTADILTRMKTLAVQASSGQLSDSDRSLLNQEYTALQSEVDRIANVTNFNGNTLLAGGGNGPVLIKQAVNGAFDNAGIGITVDSGTAATGDAFRMTYAYTDNSGSHAGDHSYDNFKVTLTDTTTGAQQTVDLQTLVNANVASPAANNANLAAGKTATASFAALGVSLTFNQNFALHTDVAASTSVPTSITGDANITTFTANMVQANTGLDNATLADLTSLAAYNAATGALTINVSNSATGNTFGVDATTGLKFSLNGSAPAATIANTSAMGAGGVIGVYDTATNQKLFDLNITAYVSAATSGSGTLAVTLPSMAFGESYTAGATTKSFDFKVGTGTSANDSVSFTLSAATQSALGINGTSIDTATNANTAITAVTAAITTVSSNRASIGASESRLAFAKSSVDVAVQNTTAAESGLLDVDVSSEITKFSSQQVLLQAGVSLLAQANQQPALLLKLLQ
jgi:flagellin